ncbi:membrane protein [Chromobacterium sp. LK1]|uniref:hypothetical protein n=1 Tax=Chromobacterium sp. LK1 TaxID=1628193 RepID=UPI0006534417|nr:hypothetical protein [Chromobacterium sp. LK1]KMN33088.1 membrane protein [Chromobacterium sp. LK1]
MTLQLEFGVLVSWLAAFLGLLIGAGKVLLAQIDRRQSERDDRQEEQTRALLKQLGQQADSVNQQLAQQAESVHRLELDFLKFQGDLPLSYVRREDYMRNQTVIEAKLDAVALKIENIQLKGAQR